jgi:hypothetical protein
MIARVLPIAEWSKLKPLYEQHNAPLPEPGAAVVYAIEDEGRIIASWPIHSILVGGLMHVDQDHRGNSIPAMLTEAVEKDLNPGDSLFTVIENPHAEKLALENGLVPLEGKLFRKDIS